MNLSFVLLTVALGAVMVPQPSAGASIQVDKDGIDFLVGKTVVSRYHVKNDLPRPFFWPLQTPDGTATTRAWPVGEAIAGEEKDHNHHRSAWFTHGDVIPEGMALKTKIKGVEGVDFWTEGKGRGKMVVTKVETPKNGPDGSYIVTHNEWLTPEGVKILDEARKIGFANTATGYLIVIEIDLLASVCPITFADTKEGSMAIRAHSALTVKQGKGKMQNAEGKINEKEIWGMKSPWVDYSGKNGANVVGVALFDDPTNPYAACWHARDYGLMAANPFGRDKHSKFPAMKGNNEPVRLAKDGHLKLRYGLYVHPGDAVQGQVEAAFQQFVKMRGMNK